MFGTTGFVLLIKASNYNVSAQDGGALEVFMDGTQRRRGNFQTKYCELWKGMKESGNPAPQFQLRPTVLYRTVVDSSTVIAKL